MDQEIFKSLKGLIGLMTVLVGLVSILIVGLLVVQYNPHLLSSSEKEREEIPPPLENGDAVKDGVHVATGLVAAEGYEVVVANCTNCHAANLITQNRGDKEHWEALIDWMQETQGLWDLGQNEAIIVAYLAEHYAPMQQGRRANLSDIEWYEFKKE
ncbi:hypothetical protein [Echinicola vietnamensis]|uniref:Monoheme cytochrome C n=1 Tax=Echinicola vietnamensis (strain DSM 17526 / LMG 23754 / KMM 6221) TaxID=926556 RepID=L0FTA8_ECHVK|nr:hypothetical protein [Echinicola vietnamensis]AGA76507.1 hypothetical protein Echvi_0211 [Echinicola vietnamensis DSM 17526]